MKRANLLKSSVADPDPGSGAFFYLDPGSGMEKIRIRDPGRKNSDPDLGTATLR
jgi:hypothetical protein